MHFLKRRYWPKKPDTSFSIAKFVLAAMLFFLGLNIVSSFRAEASTPTPSTWNLLAAGERTAVFPADSANQNNLILNNGSYFYNLSTFNPWGQGSFGFSPNSTITLDLADVRDSGAGSGQWGLCNENTTGPLRMSWKRSGASGENVPAGYRIGCSLTGVAGIRAVYQSNSLPTYYPSGPQRNIGTSTLTNGGWTQCYIGDFNGTVAYSTITTACTQTYILLAGYVGSSSGPTVSTFSSSTATPRNDSNASYSVVFSQSVTGLATDDFENAGTATGCSYSLTGSGTTYTLSISACSDGTIQPRIKANSVSGSAFDGPASAATATSTITKDSVAPSTPATPDLASDSDLGRSNSDDITRDNTPTINASGTFTGTAIVTAAKSGSTSVTCSVSSNICTLGTLSDGTWSITVTDTDSAGNSATSSALSITIDTVVPSKPIVDELYVTDGTKIMIQSSEIGSAKISNGAGVGTALVAINSANTPTEITVSVGRSMICPKLYVYDLAGNESQASDNAVCICDVIAPTSLVATPSNGGVSISFTQPSPTNSAVITNYYYSTNGASFTALSPADSTSPISISGLTNGTAYSITIKALYSTGGGSFSNPSSTVSVTPFAAPGTPDLEATSDLGTSNTDNNTSDDTPTFSLSSLAANAAVTLTATRSGGGSATCSFISTGSSGSCTFTSLPNGTYSLSAQQTLSGVTSAASTSLTGVLINKSIIDAPAAPDLADVSDSGSSSNDNITKNKRPTINVSGSFTGTATVTATKGSSHVICTISSGTCTFASDLADGVWSITASIIDTAGNISASSEALSITIDTIAPTKPSISSQYATNNMTIPVQSSEIGIAYLAANTSLTDAYLTSANNEFWNSTPITVANTSTDLSTGGLRTGFGYKYYVTDIAGNISAMTDNFVFIEAAASPSVSGPTRPNSSSPADVAGSTLTNVMSVSGVPTPVITYQYVRCPSTSGDWVPTCVNIPGATSSTYTLTTDDVGQHIGIRITATNLQGTASQLGVANAKVTAGAPGAPTNITATITGSTTASIAFTAPASNGASITDYDLQYSSNNGSSWSDFNNGTSTVNPILVTGLTANTSYVFRIIAKNSVNWGVYSVASSPQTTLMAPTISNVGPQNLASPGVFKVGDTITNQSTFDGFPTPTVTFQYFRCPTNDGVLANTYISSGCVDIPGATSSTYILTGDDVGKYMGVKITATNSSGTQVLTPKRNTLVTANSPGVPTSVSATITGSTTAAVSFSAPVSNGGSAITGYTVTSTPSGAVCAAGSSSTIYNCTGLSANTSYTFKVKATNTAGTGIDSAASSSQTTHAAPTIASTLVTATFPRLSNDVFEEFEGPGPSTGITVTVNGVTTPISTDPATGNVSIALKASSWTSTATYGSLSGYMLNFYNSTLAPIITFPSGVSQFRFLVAGLAVQPTILLTYTNGSTSDTLTLNTGGGEGAPYVITITAPSGKFINSFRITPPSQDWWHLDNISYVAALSTTTSVSSQSLTAGTAVTSFTPIAASGGGSSKTYSISPSLPSGLSLNTSTGAITGTPTGASASTSYTISVTDGSSTSTATFSLGVNAALSSSTGTVPSGVYKDVAITAFTPISFSGGTSPVTYSVSPSLPAGLSLNTSTGVISGTATGTAASTTYTVTATDANGDSEARTFAFAVTNQPTAPGAPTIGAATSTGQTTATVAFTAPANTGGAAITTYTVTASPGSITATGSSSPITVTGLTAGTAYTFSITATNAAGLTSSSSSPSSSITTETAPAPEPVCNAACEAAQNAAAKAAADKAAAEKAAAEKLVADKAAAVAVAEKTKVDVSAALAAATAAAEKVSAATVAKVAVDTIAAAVSTVVNSANAAQTSTSKITSEAAASIKSAPAAATKAASTASANSKANTAATQVKAAATAAQKAAASSQAQTSDTPEIAFGSSNTASAASQAAAKADAAARAGKAAANEVAAAAEAKSIESSATATALQNEANAAVAEVIAEQKVASSLATEAKAAADKASAATAEKIAATAAAKTASETLVTLLTEKVAIAEKVATATSEEVRAEAQKTLDTVNIKILEAERAVTETVSKADAAIAAQAEAIKVAEATKATAEAQVTKVDQLRALVPVKATEAVRAASVAAVAAKVATAAKAAAAKVPSQASPTSKPTSKPTAGPTPPSSKNSATATISGLKPGQKIKVIINVTGKK